MSHSALFERHYSAWEHFCATTEIAHDCVRPEIGRSWMRCRAAGLNPRGPKVPVQLREHELRRLLQQQRRYLDAAEPIMGFPAQAVRDSGFILVLTDANGIVLQTYGDADVLARANANNFVPGCCRSEIAVGTNSIGLTMIERRPMQLFGAEHYNSRHHSWTCSSAPVFDHDGTFLGAVTLSAESHEVHRHTLGMVIAAAEAIQNRLRERFAEEQAARTERIARSLIGRVADPLLTISSDGRILYASRGAAGLLGCTESKLGGQKITALMPGMRFDDLIASRAVAQAFEVVCDVGGQRSQVMVKSFTIRENDDDAAQGAILSLSRRESSKAQAGALRLAARYTLDDIAGSDPALRATLRLARLVAAQDARVLITGETGTGKELLAQGIHNASRRAAGPFVALNCAAMPRELIEAELLGYRDGAFTGARRGGQVGKFELADGGTLFLDEISQMPLDLQAKLLRVLQDGVVTRLGDNAPMPVDVRVIAATNEDLFAKSQAGGFRSDLFFRLSVMELALPPLRARGHDIELLAGRLLARAASKLDKGALTLSAEAMDCLYRYDWPGNIRELENVLEMAALMCMQSDIRPEHFPARMRHAITSAPARVPMPEAETTPGATTLHGIEIDAIRRALLEHNCNISRVSRALGVSRCTVYRRMRESGISRTVRVN